MSLISQEIFRKQLLDADENQLDSHEGTTDAKVLELSKPKKNKKKRERDSQKSSEMMDLKRKRREEKMRQLESSLFGNLYTKVKFGAEEAEEAVETECGAGDPLYFVDRSALGTEGVLSEDDLTTQSEDAEFKGRKPAWVDEDDEKTEVNILRVARLRKLREDEGEKVINGVQYVQRLRAQHAKLNPGTEWARIDRKTSDAVVSEYTGVTSDDSGITIGHSYDGSDIDILKSSDNLVLKDRAKLLPGLLKFTRLVDANAQEISNGPINSVQFHRNGQLLLTAGLDKRVRFFQVDGKRNPKIESIFIEDCPVHKASFLPDGSEVIISGRRKFFYSFDLVKASISKIGPLMGREEKSLESFEVSPDSSTVAFIGNEGYILLISSRTKELIGTLKMNGSVRSLAFADGGNQLLSSGGDGQIYSWDLRTRRCIHKATDDGSLTGSSLCTSPDSRFIAAGSTSGIVNVYKRDEFLGGKRKPLRSIDNLTTVVDEMRFNRDAQILAICSRKKRNGLRLVHVPSFNVFSNWPGPNFNLHYPRCLDFSPGSGFFTVGNAGGKVLLYKLHHYQNA